MAHAPHIPVLLDAVMESFAASGQGYFIDCTLGYAGHSTALLQRYQNLSLIGIDRDDEALAFSEQRLAPYDERFRLQKGTFSQTIGEIKERPIVGVLADFGVSSLQLDKQERGFSFDSDLLDMRMDQDATLSAYDVVNSYSATQLTHLFKTYGEISQAQKLSDEIIRVRTQAPIQDNKTLSDIAKRVLHSGGKIHPATLMFQAIRIEVNNELGEIEGLLNALEQMQPAGAIIALITFHSLEDRLVKNRFKQWAKQCICDPQAPRCTCGKNHAKGKVLTRKPIIADKAECKQNPRSRSAKLRCFLFKGATHAA